MARVNKAIEFIKDAADKIFIKANSIIDDNGDTLQKTLNKPRVYKVWGTVVINTGGSDGWPLHNWNQVVAMFEKQHGFTPDNQTNMIAIYINGDNTANTAHVEGASFNAYDGIYSVILREGSSGPLRITYSYFYEY